MSTTHHRNDKLINVCSTCSTRLYISTDLITPCWGEGEEGGPNVPNYPEHGAREILNPMSEYTYEVLDKLYKELAEDFPDQYVHLGMDEVYYACW